MNDRFTIFESGNQLVYELHQKMNLPSYRFTLLLMQSKEQQ